MRNIYINGPKTAEKVENDPKVSLGEIFRSNAILVPEAGQRQQTTNWWLSRVLSHLQ